MVIASCLAFVPLSGGLPLSELPLSAELVLSVGTTLGIAALAVTGAVPAWRLHLRFRPAWRLPPGVTRQVGGLALVGLAEIVVLNVSSVVSIALANGRGSTGAIVIFNYATQVFNSVAAVLAMSVVFSAFPVLAARDGPVFDRICAGSTRAVMLLSWLGTAVIVAIAVPAARVLASQPDQVPELVASFVLLAPGIAGMCVIANLVRAMFAIGRLKIAAAALAGCWVVTIIVDVVADPARAGRSGGARARAGQHDRPDRRGHPAGDSHPTAPRPGRPARRRSRDPGRAGRRDRGRRGRRGRLPRRAGQAASC